MSNVAQVFRSPQREIEVVISDSHIAIWEKGKKPRGIALSYEQSKEYRLAMKAGTFDFSILERDNTP